MGQAEIYELLLKVKEPLPRIEIAARLNTNPNKISESLRKMILHGEVQFIELDRHESKKRYNAKHRMKIYFISEESNIY